MTRTITPAAIRKTLTLRSSREKAFRVFTEGFDAWWPRTHYLGDSPLKQAVIEPGIGGRWFSRHENGAEQPWGEVLVWEPPARLVLAWRVDHSFGYDPNLLTEVELRFVDAGDGLTRVDFEHRGLERFGDTDAAQRTRTSMDEGWGMILDRFQAAAEGRPL